METIRLGKTEMMVTRLGFGGVPIQRLTEEEAVEIVRRSLDLGVNFIDTANSYTNSEERIGKAIKERRDGLILATKSFSRSPEEMEAHLQLSLKRMGVDYIDLYQFHGVSDQNSLEIVLAPDGPRAVLEKAKKVGVIRHIGITSHSVDIAKDAVKSGIFETIMIPFNCIVREAVDELLPLARKHDVGFIAMKPLAGGRLNNATIAFKYLFQFPDVVPIPGIERMGEMEELVRILEGPHEMTTAEEKEMQKLRDELGTVFCRRCDYCQPCSVGIPISGAITISNPEKLMPPERLFHGWINDVLTKAAECIECGDCEERCPYHLPIREMIKREVEWYREEKRKYEEGLTTGQKR
jgi:predicted aldo/keto reductase-like oxidoreductase